MFTGNDDDEVLVEVEEISLRKGAAMRKSEIEAAVQARAEELTGLTGPAAMLAAVGEGDQELSELYEMSKSAPPDRPQEAVEKSIPGDDVWSTIQRLAKALRDASPNTMTEAESVDAVLQKRGDLYREYVRRQAEAE